MEYIISENKCNGNIRKQLILKLINGKKVLTSDIINLDTISNNKIYYSINPYSLINFDDVFDGLSKYFYKLCPIDETLYIMSMYSFNEKRLLYNYPMQFNDFSSNQFSATTSTTTTSPIISTQSHIDLNDYYNEYCNNQNINFDVLENNIQQQFPIEHTLDYINQNKTLHMILFDIQFLKTTNPNAQVFDCFNMEKKIIIDIPDLLIIEYTNNGNHNREYHTQQNHVSDGEHKIDNEHKIDKIIRNIECEIYRQHLNKHIDINNFKLKVTTIGIVFPYSTFMQSYKYLLKIRSFENFVTENEVVMQNFTGKLYSDYE